LIAQPARAHERLKDGAPIARCVGMDRSHVQRRGGAEPERDGALEDVRKLARTSMRHRDVAGLADLMDDYLALADELEEVRVPASASKLKIAANDDARPPTSTRAA
jgi:hypothetical protein